MIIGYCIHCNHEIRLKDFFNGTDYECPNCGSLINVITMQSAINAELLTAKQ